MKVYIIVCYEGIRMRDGDGSADMLEEKYS